jgi:hypothetical protein
MHHKTTDQLSKIISDKNREILIKKAYDSLYPAFIPWEEQCFDIQNRNHQIIMECATYAVDVFLAKCKEEI